MPVSETEMWTLQLSTFTPKRFVQHNPYAADRVEGWPISSASRRVNKAFVRNYYQTVHISRDEENISSMFRRSVHLP